MCTFTFYVPTSHPDLVPFFPCLAFGGETHLEDGRERGRMGNVLDSREQISLMDIDPKLSRPLLRVATITRVLTLPGYDDDNIDYVAKPLYMLLYS